MKTNKRTFQACCYSGLKQAFLLAALAGAVCVCYSSRCTWDWRPKPRSTRILRGAIHNDAPYASTHRFLQVDTQGDCTESCCREQYADAISCPVVVSSNPFASFPEVIQYILLVFLIAFSALFSGLTLGFMGLDMTGLQIVMEGGDPVNAEYARKIYPVRKNGNLLLCTLLLGNTGVNSIISILLADKSGGLWGIVASTLVILLLGEMAPQALCSRYALYIGSRSIPLVRFIMIIEYPITFPLAWMLDKLLGKELATIYSNEELLKLLQIHVQENAIDEETGNTMTGALKYKDTKVSDVMTPLSNVFMLKVDEKLSFETIAKIFKTGYSRIPVYQIDKNNVVGLIFVKDLIFIDPEAETRVGDLVNIFGRGLHVVWPDDKLGDVLRELKLGRSHMALVRDVNNENESQDPFYEVAGIITLEDIIEEILGAEIVDETDAYLDGSHSVRLDRADALKFARLRLLDRKIVDEKLSVDEARAVTAHLWKNFPHLVSLLTEHQLHSLVAETTISVLPTAEHDIGEDLPSHLLYEKGKATDFCTLILAGKVTALVGSDQFRSDVSSWALLAPGALEDSNYTPDFTAFVSSGPCRCIQINRARYGAAVDASAYERTQHNHTESSHGEVDREDAEVSSGVGFASSGDLDDSLERIASRKAKLMTALQAIEEDSEPPSKSKVLFVDPSELTEMRKSASKRKSKPEPASGLPDSGSSRFEFIGSASGDQTMDRPDDELP